MIFLTTIFILGDENDCKFQQLLLDKLNATYRISYLKKRSNYCRGDGYELLAIENTGLSLCEFRRPLVLLKKDYSGRIGCILPMEATIIACSENEKQIKALRRQHCHIITCGFRATDTFSYSSISDERIIVSLNREITALSGKKIQPLEIPVETTKEADIYSFIAFTALRLLLDDFESDIGRLY